MCGIAGYFDFANRTEDQTILRAMTDSMLHRGPDSAGYWTDAEAGVNLGHRRLAIVDLSEAGSQPMTSPFGRFVLVYNGELYNHTDLRELLDAESPSIEWRGHSDTETLLAGFELWGVQATLEKTIGMFAFALWDKADRRLVLGRDRMGEKPLYYGWQGQSFLFGSELKSIRAHPSFQAKMSRASIALYSRHNYIPAPYSIYDTIYKLTPGAILTIDCAPDKIAIGETPAPIPYWTLAEAEAQGAKSPFQGTREQAACELETLLLDAVKRQMMADVPLGAFLSGGIDSSTIVALMQAQSEKKINTFTIGFSDLEYNEAVHAKAVAEHLGTHHTELYVTPEQAMDVIPKMPSLYDEPFGDSSQIPTYLVSRMTRESVTVSLSGDAGDELFGGYARYFLARDIWGKLSKLPGPLRQLATMCIRSVPPSAWENILNFFFNRVLNRSISRPGDKAHRLADLLSTRNLEIFYRDLVSHVKDPPSFVLDSTEPPTALTDPLQWSASKQDEHRMMFTDSLSYLPDDILAKVDRAAMGVSLETRVPFLDHRVVEFAWRLPLSMKICDGQGKRVLRDVLYKYVPKELIERPKMGFGIPIDGWLRGPLREWAESLLNEKRLKEEGVFDPTTIRKKWSDQLSGARDWQYHLWDILMFQAWLEETKP